ISREGSLIDLGVDSGIVKKSGAWFTYDGDQLGQGKENVRNFLKDNPDLANEIEKKIREHLGIGARMDAPADARPATVPTAVAPAPPQVGDLDEGPLVVGLEPPMAASKPPAKPRSTSRTSRAAATD
ncbi:MAG: DNA recombination/repair protein RecA, partial [Actinomycetales bacterium]